mmetsp:Transcript_21375/g.48400  ORF Transcript_21375/g.48400 Transcript_21375/m.48400 type:complete len:236 (+) Transcript_21375:248-955(+)
MPVATPRSTNTIAALVARSDRTRPFSAHARADALSPSSTIFVGNLPLTRRPSSPSTNRPQMAHIMAKNSATFCSPESVPKPRCRMSGAAPPNNDSVPSALFRYHSMPKPGSAASNRATTWSPPFSSAQLSKLRAKPCSSTTVSISSALITQIANLAAAPSVMEACCLRPRYELFSIRTKGAMYTHTFAYLLAQDARHCMVRTGTGRSSSTAMNPPTALSTQRSPMVSSRWSRSIP